LFEETRGDVRTVAKSTSGSPVSKEAVVLKEDDNFSRIPLLPQSLLESAPEVRPISPQPMSSISSTDKLKNPAAARRIRHVRFLEDSSRHKRTKDLKKGPINVRVLEQSMNSRTLPPRTNRAGQYLRETLLKGEGRKGAKEGHMVLERQKAMRGFLRR
jgi:hypothetical protein